MRDGPLRSVSTFRLLSNEPETETGNHAITRRQKSIRLFDRHYPSAPTYRRKMPARTAAVRDGPVFGATAKAACPLVLDGREHDGSLVRVGG